jgi:photosystem II stability/assembly factor-like uncharacterized protein
MKTVIVLLASFLPFMGQSQWTGIYYHSDQETALAVVNKDTIVAVTYQGGRIHRSTNGGATWSFVQTIFEDSWFNDVHFPTQNVGYACGGGGTAFGAHKQIIAKTSDAGQTWDSITSNSFFGLSFNSIRFQNADTGFVSQESTGMIKTLDGGNTFSPLSTPGRVTTIAFDQNNVLFIGLRTEISTDMYVNSIRKSTNLGASWTPTYLDTVTGSNQNQRAVNKIQFVSSTIGYAVGNNGMFLKTSNGGESWNRTFLSPFTGLSTVHFTDENTGYVNLAGGFYRTTDGGNSWEVQNMNPLSVVRQIEFANDTLGFAVVDQGIYKTTNAGVIAGISANTISQAFHLFPNPVTSQVQLSLNTTGLKEIQITNQVGQIMYKTKSPDPSISIDFSSFSSGVYFVSILTNGQKYTRKLIKE